jgi:hypothetical protein
MMPWPRGFQRATGSSLGTPPRLVGQLAKRLNECEPVDSILTARPQFKTLPAGSQCTAGPKDDSVRSPEHSSFLELVDADMPDRHGVETGKCQDQPPITARGCGRGRDRPAQSRFDDRREQAAAHDGAEHSAELVLPLGPMRPKPTSPAMALPGRGMSDFMEERCQKGIGIEVFVDRDPMDVPISLRRAVVAELRSPRPHDAHIHMLPPERVLDVARQAGWKPCDNRVIEHHTVPLSVVAIENVECRNVLGRHIVRCKIFDDRHHVGFGRRRGRQVTDRHLAIPRA